MLFSAQVDRFLTVASRIGSSVLLGGAALVVALLLSRKALRKGGSLAGPRWSKSRQLAPEIILQVFRTSALRGLQAGNRPRRCGAAFAVNATRCHQGNGSVWGGRVARPSERFLGVLKMCPSLTHLSPPSLVYSPPSEGGMAQHIRALVVDDESTMRYTVRGILEHLGFEVIESPDGADALAKLDEGDFQLVVTDIQMPRMDGLDLLRRICERPSPQPKVIVMTAHGSERHAVEAIKLGAFDYFKKPFEVEEMMAVASRATESVRLLSEVERLEGERTLGRTLIFGAPAMSRLAVMVRRIAPRDVTVLLTGESGQARSASPRPSSKRRDERTSHSCGSTARR